MNGQTKTAEEQRAYHAKLPPINYQPGSDLNNGFQAASCCALGRTVGDKQNVVALQRQIGRFGRQNLA
jgi:hypothetical protein